MLCEVLLVNQLWPSNPVNRRYRCLDADYSKVQQVEQPAGACLAITREAWEAVGGMDTQFAPVWFEDVDFCKRLLDSGRKIVYCPAARFHHSGAHSVSKLSFAEKQLFWYTNMLRYARKHFPGDEGLATVAGVVVNVNARQRVDLKLLVGEETTTQAAGAAATIQTDSSEKSRLVQKEQATELPLNGRNYSDLALVTGVTRTPNGIGGSRPREGSFTVNGLRATFNSFLLDGTDNNCYATSVQGGSSQVTSPAPDSIAQFRIITNNYTADYGRAGGAIINVVTKSGTNQLHGTAYDFVRNTILNTAGYQFGIRPSNWQKPILQQNQFGMSLGGPVIKNRSFFFAAYEGARVVSKALSFTTVPTMDDRRGIFPVAVRNPVTGKVYPAGGGIPLSEICSITPRFLSTNGRYPTGRDVETTIRSFCPLGLPATSSI